MGAQGTVVLPGQGSVWNVSPARSLVLKLLGRATGGSIMLFEEIVPAGTKSWFHLHHGSDEVAYVLSGELTFKIGDEVTVGGAGTCAFMPRGVQHAWKNSGAETARVLFLYTPAGAGGLLEEQQRAQDTPASRDEREAAEQRRRYGWEIVGPNPL
jgi:quercetin dioxygenase-like cupin family protein